MRIHKGIGITKQTCGTSEQSMATTERISWHRKFIAVVVALLLGTLSPEAMAANGMIAQGSDSPRADAPTSKPPGSIATAKKEGISFTISTVPTAPAEPHTTKMSRLSQGRIAEILKR